MLAQKIALETEVNPDGWHYVTRRAVPIEPSLRSLSPENGNISKIRRRLSAISLPQRPISEPGDQ